MNTRYGHPRGPWTRWRRASQALVALLYLGLPVAHRLGWRGVTGNLASLRIGPLDLDEPAASLSAALAAHEVTFALLLGAAPVVLLALALGPVFCSWACPWGLLSEGLDSLRQRLRHRHWRADGFRRLRRPRAAWLAGLMLVSLLAGTPLAATLAAPRLITALPLELVYLRLLSPLTGGLLLGLLALELVGPRRLWCRALCPAGATANYLRTRWTKSVDYDPDTCLCPTTPACLTACRWGVDPRHMGRYDGCTNCLACVDSCPRGALCAPRLRPQPEPRRPAAVATARQED